MAQTHKVELYIYDLSMGMAKQFSQQLVGRHFDGIWHTAIVAFGFEYFYGGGGGIAKMPPGSTHFGKPVQILQLGVTNLSLNDFEDFLVGIASRFHGASYDLLQNNCNHFSQEAAQFLTGQNIPDNIRNQPSDFLATPMGAMIKPMIDQMYGRANAQSTHIGGNPSSPSLPHDAAPLLAAVSPAATAAPAPAPALTPALTSGASAPAPAAKPKHSHLSIPLAELGYSLPLLLEAGDPKAIVAKLSQFIAEASGAVTLSADESAFLNLLTEALNKRDKNAAIAANSFSTLEKLIRLLPREKVFPALDALRLALHLWPKAATESFAKRDFVNFLVQNYASERARNDTPKPATLLSVRVLVNLFAGEAGARIACFQCADLSTDAAVFALQHQDAAVRLAGATLAYNMSLYLVCQDTDEVGRLLSALSYALDTHQTKPDEEVAYVLLMALGHFLFCNDTAMDLVHAMEPPLAVYITKSTVQKIKRAAADVKSLLASHKAL